MFGHEPWKVGPACPPGSMGSNGNFSKVWMKHISRSIRKPLAWSISLNLQRLKRWTRQIDRSEKNPNISRVLHVGYVLPIELCRWDWASFKARWLCFHTQLTACWYLAQRANYGPANVVLKIKDCVYWRLYRSSRDGLSRDKFLVAMGRAKMVKKQREHNIYQDCIFTFHTSILL